MPLYTGLEFTKIFNWDGVGTAGSDYTDVTLEAQSPAGTSFTIFNTSAHYLYLGMMKDLTWLFLTWILMVL